jgi:hypothetical protein
MLHILGLIGRLICFAGFHNWCVYGSYRLCCARCGREEWL